MKRPNWKLFFLLNDIKLGFSILCLIGAIIIILFLFDSVFPIFKYSILCLKTIAWSVLLLSSTGMFVIINKLRKKPFYSFSNHKKIVYSLVSLTLSLTFLSSIEYLIYINNKDYFNVENSYIKNSVNDKINSINKNITYCEKYMNEYSDIYRNIKSDSYIHYINENDLLYTIIDTDTIQIRLHKIPNNTSTMPNRFNKHNKLFVGVKAAGISLKNELYNISHPSSKTILEAIKCNDSISGSNFCQLVKEKIEFYENKINSYNTILSSELTISFWDFIIYNIFNPSITGNKTHILIRLIFLLQAIIITFISGYIYQTLYKILDGDNKPEH
nr:MAG TPA: hypothetical protein [Caudoviricetes sp.]